MKSMHANDRETMQQLARQRHTEPNVQPQMNTEACRPSPPSTYSAVHRTG